MIPPKKQSNPWCFSRMSADDAQKSSCRKFDIGIYTSSSNLLPDLIFQLRRAARCLLGKLRSLAKDWEGRSMVNGRMCATISDFPTSAQANCERLLAIPAPSDRKTSCRTKWRTQICSAGKFFLSQAVDDLCSFYSCEVVQHGASEGTASWWVLTCENSGLRNTTCV